MRVLLQFLNYLRGEAGASKVLVPKLELGNQCTSTLGSPCDAPRGKTLLNRTDLLACLKYHGEGDLESFAALFGFEVRKEPNHAPIVHEAAAFSSATSYMSATATVLKAKTSAQFHRIVARRRFTDEERNLDEPEWYVKAQPFEEHDVALNAPVGVAPPFQPALMPWPRLWPWLKLALGAQVQSHKPDLPRVVDCLARGEMLRRLPRVRRKAWAVQAQLILDFDASLTPFWSDFNRLREQLADFRGQTGLEVLAFPDGDPAGRCWQDTPEGWRDFGAYRPPAAGIPILLLSDLGCNEAGEQRRLRWLRFGNQLARTNHRVMALLPCPPRCWDDELAQLFISAYWDRAVRPPQHLSRGLVHSAVPSPQPSPRGRGGQNNAERLLTALACTLRVEPALLRAMRLLFPAMDVGAEYAAWNHADVHPTSLGFYFDSDKVADYRERLRVAVDLPKPDKIADLMLDHHAHLSPVIGHEEQLALAELLNRPCPEQPQIFAGRLAKTLDGASGEIGLLSRQWLGRMGARQHTSLWNNEPLKVAWVKAHIDDESFSLPEGLSLENLAWALKPKMPVRRRIYQQGEALFFSEADIVPSSLVGEVLQATDYVQVEVLNEDGETEASLLHHISQPIPLDPMQRLLIRTDSEELQLDSIARPNWASAIGRDKYGLYADFELKGIVQRFRWINPGSFLMGSPASEAGRWDNELQHEVTLTQGYWLADTACTQALWMAVMNENPGRFNGDSNNPVETVSWDDVQGFIERLNQASFALNARLPTEAQWEYVCRAGTISPFSFGANITPEQVNYDGGSPYTGGAKGIFREKTVPVKSLPVNPWGLYEMHGNVWEWCQDWYGEYSSEAVVDPAGPVNGSNRVLRGGCWINRGRFTRSAFRFEDGPARRIDSVGFRLALG